MSPALLPIKKIKKIVFSFLNYSKRTEKILKCSFFKKTFWNSRPHAENLQNFWDHGNNLFRQWKFRTIFKTGWFLNLFLEVTHILFIIQQLEMVFFIDNCFYLLWEKTWSKDHFIYYYLLCQIANETFKMPIGTNIWDVETYRKKLER